MLLKKVPVGLRTMMALKSPVASYWAVMMAARQVDWCSPSGVP